MRQAVWITLFFISWPLAILALTLTWPSNTQPNVSYKLYYGSQSHTYTNAVDTGTNTSFTLSTAKGVTYYFAVVAYDPANGIESDFSAETIYTPTTNTVYHLTLGTASNLTDWTPLLTLNITNNQPQAFYNLTISK